MRVIAYGNARRVAHEIARALVRERGRGRDLVRLLAASDREEARLLAAAGFTKSYNVVDGVEGDLVDDPKSANHGKRTKNGWKNTAPARAAATEGPRPNA